MTATRKPKPARERVPTRREKVVILCGGQGTRMREETEFRPKALVEIGGKPVLWHLMRHYDHFGFRRFVLCLGYRGNMIKEYFVNYHWMMKDFTLKLGEKPSIAMHDGATEDWEITFVDTGLATQTGGRLARVQDQIDTDWFLANYCDGLSDVDLDELIEFHGKHKKIATLTGFHPHSKYGVIRVDPRGIVNYWQEKPLMNDYTSGGFFVFKKSIFKYVERDEGCILEHGPFRKLAKAGQMALFQHTGFWQCMDTFKEAQALNHLWDSGRAPWQL
jgi:glucose-1-phosphate cytidylyltransferase